MGEGPRERSTISVRGVLIGFGAIVGSVLIAVLAARALLGASGGASAPVTGQPFTRAAGPPLEVTPHQQLQRYRAEQRRKLEGYHLVDEKAGVVRIPIERAMTLVADEHAAAEKEGASR